MARKLLLSTVLMLSIVMVSCSTKPNDTNNSNTTPNTTVEQNKDNKDSNTNSSKTETAKSNDEAKATKIKLSIYTINENSLEPNESSTFELDSKTSLDDKLKQLAKVLSEKKFENLSIQIKSIDTVNGKKVATINLTDSNGKKWSSKFQGSTGGAVTANTLTENFLQSNNKAKGEWIDGVKFLYNNEKIEYEHVSNLSETQYKN